MKHGIFVKDLGSYKKSSFASETASSAKWLLIPPTVAFPPPHPMLLAHRTHGCLSKPCRRTHSHRSSGGFPNYEISSDNVEKNNQYALVANINKNPIIMGIRPNNIFIEYLLVYSIIQNGSKFNIQAYEICVISLKIRKFR